MIHNGLLRAHPRVIDTSEAGLRLVEDEEGGEVGGVRGHDDHGEPGPDHAQHSGGEAAWGPLTYTKKIVVEPDIFSLAKKKNVL